MNRRAFLGALLAAFVVDPERLLWIPGRKLVSIPKPRPRFLTSDMILDQALSIYVRESAILRFKSRKFGESFNLALPAGL